MATRQFIPPFPQDEDRHSFGWLITGFTAGEGSFILAWSKNRGYAKFVIALRDDDREILEKIRSFFGCGTMYTRIDHKSPKAHPQIRFNVSRTRDPARIIVPHFDQNPLWPSKKARDFVIWKEGVELLYRVVQRSRTMPGVAKGFVTKWTKAEVERFRLLATSLNEQRRYNGPPAVIPPPLPVPANGQGHLFDL